MGLRAHASDSAIVNDYLCAL